MNIARLCALAEAHALASEAAGRLSADVVAEADRCGAFNSRVPAELGGADVSLVEQFELTEALSRADGGAGWTISFMALSSGLVSALVPGEGAAEIAPAGRWPRFCGTFPYSGVARREPGGWRVSGRWAFASGIDHAEWLAAGCRVDGSPTDLLWVAVPAGAAIVDPDSWDVDGLRGTGSKTYVLDDEHVPDRRVFTVTAPPHVRGRPIHRLPTLVFITPEHAGVALGLARRALDEVLALAAGKLRLGGRLALGDREAFLRDIGRADTQWRAARALVVERLGHAELLANRGDPAGPELTFDVRRAAAHAADAATHVASLAYRYAGGSAIGRTHPLHRAWRDVHTATQHVHVNDEIYVSWAEATAGRTSGWRSDEP